MPEISRFYGIIVRMFYNDHAPPHFHASYAEHEAVFGIESLAVLSGKLPSRAHGLVVEWASQHQDELLDDWHRGRNLEPLHRIDPLP